ncbi:hypothetical protein ILP92_04245 [Maribius pontilimi]|uniref:Uncharacterized protein n=1 Tax=Palleronia pontilimi TaxID=1964209 RepID=A0A934MBR0_9RHOB|nr:hypothetical protein [Palleronia pontilimi]MBJ3761958.1 hypothetical protein [Palleronia pontilimi]
MAERQRSKDGVKETEKFTDEAAAPSHQGRSDGALERKVGTRDLENTAKHGEGATRVTKSDEKGEGNLGGHHGTGGDD